MGQVKEMYFDRLEQSRNEEIAKLLGITYDELCETNWHIEVDESRDGLVYGYIICFEDDSPAYVLKKITKLDKNNQVWLSPNVFDEPVVL